MPLPLQNLISLALTLAALAGLLAALHLQERAVGRYLAHNLGWRSVLLTGWLGVPVHELGHLAFAGVFGHRVVSWKLFEPDPVSGTLGYVRHAHSRHSLYQVLGTVFIAMGPLITGGLTLCALLYWMLPGDAAASLWRQALALGGVESWRATGRLALRLVTEIWQHRSAWLPLQLYLAICVASHLCPSRADLAGALRGGALLLALMTGAVALCGWQGISTGGVAAVTLPLLLVVLLAGAFQGLYVVVVAAGLSLSRR